MIFASKIKELFNIESAISAKMEAAVTNGINIYKGEPDWIDEEDNIRTINFAKSICSEVARLATLATKITIDGSARAEHLQKVIDKSYFKIREWVEYACAYGTVIIKPSDNGIDLFLPDKFLITRYDGDTVTGVVFIYQEKVDEKYYTRFEYHDYIDEENYRIYNRCCVGASFNSLSEDIEIEKTPWNGLLEEANIVGMEKPAFGVLRTPHANNIDINSAISLPIFSEAVEELEDLDIAYSRNAKEIYDSKRILLIDSDKMIQSGVPVKDYQNNFESNRKALGLPDMVKNVFGNGQEDFYQEINPNLNTDTRLSGINALLSQIGYKVGFSNGYFVFNENSGIQTATGVEADQQRTIQFIKDVRDKLEDCLIDVINGLNVFANTYNLAPNGNFEIVFDFGDITYNREEDRARWWNYVNAGKVPAWMYFVKFEGMSEEDAKAMVGEAQPKEMELFGGEE